MSGLSSGGQDRGSRSSSGVLRGLRATRSATSSRSAPAPPAAHQRVAERTPGLLVLPVAAGVAFFVVLAGAGPGVLADDVDGADVDVVEVAGGAGDGARAVKDD